MFGMFPNADKPFATLGTSLYSKVLSYVSSTTVSIVKSIGKVLIATPEYVVVVLVDIALHLISLITNVTSSASLTNSVSKTLTVLSTSVAALTKLISKTLTAVSNVTVSLTKSSLVLLASAIASVTPIIKQIGKPLSYTSTVTATLVKARLKELIATVTSTATLVKTYLHELTVLVTSFVTLEYSRFYFITMSIVSSVITTLERARIVLLTVLSTTTVSMFKHFEVNLLLIYQNAIHVYVTLRAVFFSVFGTRFGRTLYIKTRDRLAQLVKFRDMSIGNERDRDITLVKIREISPTKDDTV